MTENKKRRTEYVEVGKGSASTSDDDLKQLLLKRTEAQAALDRAQTALNEISNRIDIRSIDDVFRKFAGPDGTVKLEHRYYGSPSDPATMAVESVGWGNQQTPGVLHPKQFERLFKVLSSDGSPGYGGDPWSMPTQNADGSWIPGEWRETNKVAICATGLHGANVDQIGEWHDYGDTVVEMEYDGPVFYSATYNKVVGQRARLIRIIGTTKDVIDTKYVRDVLLDRYWTVARTNYIRRIEHYLSPESVKEAKTAASPAELNKLLKKEIAESQAITHELRAKSWRDTGGPNAYRPELRVEETKRKALSQIYFYDQEIAEAAGITVAQLNNERKELRLAAFA